MSDTNRSEAMDDEERGRELARVTAEVAGRLAARGVHLAGNETAEEVAAIEDALERFERAVEARGGDLMVDEPPAGRAGEPDQERFRLPVRTSGMSVPQYVELLARATDGLRSRRHPRHGTS